MLTTDFTDNTDAPDLFGKSEIPAFIRVHLCNPWLKRLGSSAGVAHARSLSQATTKHMNHAKRRSNPRPQISRINTDCQGMPNLSGTSEIPRLYPCPSVLSVVKNGSEVQPTSRTRCAQSLAYGTHGRHGTLGATSVADRIRQVSGRHSRARSVVKDGSEVPSTPLTRARTRCLRVSVAFS